MLRCLYTRNWKATRITSCADNHKHFSDIIGIDLLANKYGIADYSSIAADRIGGLRLPLSFDECIKIDSAYYNHTIIPGTPLGRAISKFFLTRNRGFMVDILFQDSDTWFSPCLLPTSFWHRSRKVTLGRNSDYDSDSSI